MGSRVIVVAAVLAALACGTSCGGSSSSGGPSGNALQKALAQLADTSEVRTEIDFGRPAKIAALDDHKATGPYSGIEGVGESQLARDDQGVRSALGFDPLTADVAVTAGSPPNSAALLDGVDLGSVGDKLTGLGASRSTSHGATTYRFRPDNQQSLDDKLAKALPTVLSSMDVVQIDGPQLRYASASAGIARVTAEDHTLAEDPDYAAVARCLDDPLAATFVDRLAPILGGSLPSSSAGVRGLPQRTSGVRLVAVGVDEGKSGQPIEHLCVRAASDDSAKQIADSVSKALSSGKSVVTNEPWSRILSSPSVTTDGATVSMTATPVRGIAGVLYVSLTRGDLPGVYG